MLMSNNTLKKVSIGFLSTMLVCLLTCFIISCIKFSPVLNFKAQIKNPNFNDLNGDLEALFYNDWANSYLTGLVFYTLCFFVSIIVCCLSIYLTIQNKKVLIFGTGFVAGLLSLANIASTSSFLQLANTYYTEFTSSNILSIYESLIISIVILILIILSFALQKEIIRKILVFISFGLLTSLVFIDFLYVFVDGGVEKVVSHLCMFILSVIGMIGIPVSLLPDVVNNKEKEKNPSSPKSIFTKKIRTKKPIKALKDLKYLLDNEIITKEEFEEKKRKYIDVL